MYEGILKLLKIILAFSWENAVPNADNVHVINKISNDSLT